MQPPTLPIAFNEENPCKYEEVNIRPIAEFHPSFWGDRFLNYTPLDEVIKWQKEQEAKALQQVMRKELLAVRKDPKERLIFVDAVERLGVAYHFEEEIDAILQNFRNNQYESDYYKNDLHYVSLYFRLMRQHGFYVSNDVFNEFKDKNGSFKEALKSEVEGILSLYEASYLRVHGEKILEEALAFTTHHLTSFAKNLSTPMAGKIKHALKRPLHKSIQRLEAKYQISLYELEPSNDDILLRFAKLDFDLLQSLHKAELQALTRWWKDLDFTTKLPYARDRFVECYFWNVSLYPEPKYSFSRIINTKLLQLVSIIDDTYDAYGTIQELELFTQAIHRWNKDCMNELPEYMKLVYETLLDTVYPLEHSLAKEGRSYAMHYFQQETKDLCVAYLKETKWCHSKYVPTFDEYIRNGVVSSTYLQSLARTYLFMEVANKDAFEWLHRKPKSIVGSCIIGRVLNDLASYKFEKKRKHVATAVECYVKEFGVSEEAAYEKLQQVVEDGWKDLLEEMFGPTKVAMPLLIQVLNLNRTSHEMYTIDLDGYTMTNISQAKVAAVLIDNNATI